MRLLLATALAVPLIGSTPTPADAQSFLEGLARRAVERAAGSVVSGDRPAERPAERPGDRSGPGRAAAPAAPAMPSGPAPWPLNAGDATYTGDLEFSAEDQARADGLSDFAKVRCTGCEGGYSYDNWITHHRDMTVDEVAAHVGGLSVGETLTWTGIEATGRLEVLSEAPVADFPCKQVRIVMTRGEATYETPGLYCFGKSHAYAKEMWVEVL